LLAAVEYARGVAGVSQVQLAVSERSAAAVHLYERAGFVRWGTEPAALRIGAESVAEHYMVLVLQAPPAASATRGEGDR